MYFSSRVLGIVVEIIETSIGPIILVDDSSGVITVHFRGSIHNHVKKLSIGSLVECFAELRPPSFSPCFSWFWQSNYLYCVGITVKNDPLHEVLRYLQIVHLYRHHYFGGVKPDLSQEYKNSQEEIDNGKRKNELESVSEIAEKERSTLENRLLMFITNKNLSSGTGVTWPEISQYFRRDPQHRLREAVMNLSIMYSIYEKGNSYFPP